MKRRRLGFGDFTHDGPNPMARTLYLHAVWRCVPEALHALVALNPQGEAPLRAWAETWGFSDDWALDCARAHAQYWRDDPNLFGHWIVMVPNWEPIFPNGPSWNPIAETEAAFRARVNAYIAGVKQTPGIKATPEKRGAIDPGKEHFEWLALHHVGKWTEAAITEKYQDADRGLNVGSVSEAITKTAELVGLTLRSAPGRRLGSKTLV
jgi:hypothetical protein